MKRNLSEMSFIMLSRHIVFFLMFSCILLNCESITDEWPAKESSEYCTKNDCSVNDVSYDYTANVLRIKERTNHVIDLNLPSWLKTEDVPTKCKSSHGDSIACITWQEQISADVRKHVLDKTPCFTFVFKSKFLTPNVCIPLDGAHWYGGSTLHNQRWPLENVQLQMQPYISQDLVVMKTSFGNILEPYWINSQGIGISVEDTTPLHVSINEDDSKQLCLKSQFQSPHFRNFYDSDKILNFTVCKSENVVEVHKMLSKKLFRFPEGTPDYKMIKSPIWSTWARYKTLIDQKKVLEFADEIMHHNFSNSQLEIDDMFSSKYGDFDFVLDKFPDPEEMIKKLNTIGFRTTVWITPFANLDSKAFLEGSGKGYWLKDISGKVPALVKWWQGIGGILDVTKLEAVDWFVNRLSNMRQEYGIDSFKFDAGEMSYLPSSYATSRPLANPGFFISKYVDAVSRLGDLIEVRCGYKSQRHPIFVRMADKESVWGYDNGLKTLIPTVLTIGILGYPYILPDMIGGNGYGENLGIDVVLPDRELYIRWLQITAFLPAMQFSFVPWDYDSEVVAIAKKMVDIHELVVTPLLMEAAKESQKSGSPLIRPLWWIDPYDKQAQTTDDQFLVGDTLLVAPIIEAGARSRDIYLPTGNWLDELNQRHIPGGQWLRNYKIELNDVATFKLLT